jgi:hypothetical protein
VHARALTKSRIFLSLLSCLLAFLLRVSCSLTPSSSLSLSLALTLRLFLLKANIGKGRCSSFLPRRAVLQLLCRRPAASNRGRAASDEKEEEEEDTIQSWNRGRSSPFHSSTKRGDKKVSLARFNAIRLKRERERERERAKQATDFTALSRSLARRCCCWTLQM